MTNIIITPQMLAKGTAAHVPVAGVDYKHTVLFDGKLLPVISMFDSTGFREPNYFNARACVAYVGAYKFKDFTPGVLPKEAARDLGSFVMICVNPGEISKVRDYHAAFAAPRP